MNKIFESFTDYVNDALETKIPNINDNLANEFLNLLKTKDENNNIKDITPSKIEYDNLFANSEKTGLIENYPQLFGAKIIKRYFPNIEATRGRQMMFFALLEPWVHSYIREKDTFDKTEAFIEAKKENKNYVFISKL